MIGSNGEKKGWLICPERKCVGWTEESVHKFSELGELLSDLSSGTFARAKGCWVPPHRRHLVGCELAVGCFAASTERLVKTCAKQGLNEKSDISGTVEVVHGAR